MLMTPLNILMGFKKDFNRPLYLINLRFNKNLMVIKSLNNVPNKKVTVSILMNESWKCFLALHPN